MASPVQFWFDFASTYSYPAALCLTKLAAEQDIRIEWRSFLLGPIFQQQGWQDSPFNLFPAKGRYMWLDLPRLCAKYDLPWRKPSMFPRNGLLAARICCWYAEEDWVSRFVQSVFQANFVNDEDISSAEILGNCLLRMGIEPQPILQQAQSPESKQKLMLQTRQASTLGIFGAPTFVVGEELFWGNERLTMALQRC